MRIRKILLAHDFSTEAGVAEKEAIILAENIEFELIVLHVIRDAWVEIPKGERAQLKSFSAGDLVHKADALCQEKLKAILAKAKKVPEERKRYLIRVGDPGDRILEFVEENDIDVVVLGDLGRSVLKNHVLGSVAEKVVHKADCSVLIAKTLKRRVP